MQRFRRGPGRKHERKHKPARRQSSVLAAGVGRQKTGVLPAALLRNKERLQRGRTTGREAQQFQGLHGLHARADGCNKGRDLSGGTVSPVPGVDIDTHSALDDRFVRGSKTGVDRKLRELPEGEITPRSGGTGDLRRLLSRRENLADL